MKHRPCGNGKGDTPRPITDREQFDKNWDNIFKKVPNGKEDMPALNESLRTYDGKLDEVLK